MTATNKQWRIGDEGWVVEWCSKLVISECGDHDHGRSEFQRELFETHGEAVGYAKRVYPLDQYGSVKITPFRMEQGSDGELRDVYIGDAEFYEGE